MAVKGEGRYLDLTGLRLSLDPYEEQLPSVRASITEALASTGSQWLLYPPSSTSHVNTCDHLDALSSYLNETLSHSTTGRRSHSAVTEVRKEETSVSLAVHEDLYGVLPTSRLVTCPLPEGCLTQCEGQAYRCASGYEG